ncbi:MAG TPA: diguanylate cyclase [Actinoplanes sp.]|nr:diguanylate cyclase [Actinoplanes sp.]
MTATADAPRAPGVTVIDELGRGANAVTYRIRRAGRDWAMKAYAAEPDGGRAALLALRREAALLMWVDHPGLIQVHEVGLADGHAYMIMDLVEGRSLAEVLGSGPLSVAEAVRLSLTVAETLAAVHRVGLVHRDVKPQNIMIEPGGRARLIDFGMAARAHRDSGDGAAGTFRYAAPEQAGMIKRPVDGRADLYALGAVLFECLSGTPPFVTDDTAELLRMHAVAPAPPLSEHRPDTPGKLSAIVGRLLAKDPDDRYESASLLAADLRAIGGAGPADADADQPAALVGRDRQWETLRAAWERTRAGRGGTALIIGGAGSGKTRMAYDFATHVRRAGVPVLRAQCSAGAAPLAALRAAVEHYLDHVRRAPEPELLVEQLRAAAAATGTAAAVGQLSPSLADALGTADTPGSASLEGEPAMLSRAVGVFLAELARSCGGALLCLDDVDAADPASLATLRQLIGLLDDSPLLVLGTAGERPALSAIFEGPAPVIALDPLEPAAVAQLVTSCARGLRAGDELVQRLVARGGVTPFEVVEYVRAVVDAGLLAPSWGGWTLDTEGLDAVPLPADVFGLMLRRIADLDPAARQLLTVAALIGPTFPPELAVQVSGLAGAAEGAAALDDALARRVVERRGGRFAFIHDGIRTALLADLDEGRARELHQSVAEALDRDKSEDPEHVHAVARHYQRGDIHRAPGRAAAACLAAGRLALAHHSPADAIEFFETVQRLADLTPWLVRHEVDELLGAAYYQAGRLADAERVLARALEAVPTRLDRARVLNRMSQIQQAVGDLSGSTATVRRALAELGRPLPANRLLLVVSTLLSFAAGLVVERFRIGFGTADPDRRARYRLRARLNNTAAISAILMMDPLATVMLTLRSLYPASRLGAGAEYARARVDTGSLLSSLGLPPGRAYARAGRVAELVGEPGVVGHFAWVQRSLPHVLGKADIRRLVPDVLDRTRVIETSNYLKMLEGCVFLLLDAGYAGEAQALHADGVRRVDETDLSAHSVAVWGIATAAALGRIAEADALQRGADERPPSFSNPGDRQTRLHASVRSALEQRDAAAFDRAAADFAALGLKAWAMPLYRRSIFSAIAYGRVEQCLVAPADAGALAAADRAVRDLRRAAAGGMTLAAHHLIVRAYLRHLRGDHEGALVALAAADRTLRAADAPLVSYEAARLRARALQALGRRQDAAAHAATALVVADRQGWPHRAQWIRTEFDLGTAAPTGLSVASGSGSAGTFSNDRQRLAAIERLSTVASRILDPVELTRVALDEIITLLGAERAYLFLADDADRLVPRQGRDAAGTDLTILTGYGSTLVERVRHSRETLVVTGTDEGLALGSQSVLAHGLRSIMVAPLLLDGRLLGVVYLDSRIAKGMFTGADAGVLAALTTHVAAALETARAAELAVAVRAARRERDVAETLREAMADLSGTLHPADVLRRLRATLGRVLPARTSWLAVVDAGKLQVWDDQGRPGDAVPADAAAEPALAALLNAVAPVSGGPGTPPPAPFEAAAGHPWLAVPLHAREQGVGLVVLVSRDPAGYRDSQVEIAATLAGHGMTAYENARLFAQVEHLATTDDLTRLFNRRHFFTLAMRELALARRRPGQLTAVMLDIDHFKQVNDRYGHQVGDEVIATVSQRLAATVRTTDLIGRYGGEEFAIMLPDTSGEGSVVLAERLRAAIGDRPIETGAGELRITISVGVAHLGPDDMAVTDLLGRADRGLYEAKRAGRDRVVLAID